MARRPRSSQNPESQANLIPFSKPILSPSIGTLRAEIELQEQTIVPSGTGAPNAVWSTTETVRARVTPLSGSEYVRALATGHKISHQIDMRFHDFNTKMRIKYGVRIFDPVYIQDIQNRHTQLRVMATEVL